jgi:hypothetical protein
MATAGNIVGWGGSWLSSRAARSIPWVGAAVALLTVAETVRRKGVFGGALDTGLNAVPYLGAAKNVVETVRGRDFIADRRHRSTAARPILPAPRRLSPAR